LTHLFLIEALLPAPANESARTRAYGYHLSLIRRNTPRGFRPAGFPLTSIGEAILLRFSLSLKPYA
jgi:hypothetical protein